MPYPGQPVSFLVFVSLGVVAFRALGSIIAAVANSMQESQILIQTLYFPMLLLSGATIPLAVMPTWLQMRRASLFPRPISRPACKGFCLGRRRFSTISHRWRRWLLTAVLATFLGVKLFRWEKEEKMRGSAKLWLLAVLAPFVLMGTWQAHAKDNLAKVQDAGARSRTAALLADSRRAVVPGRWNGDRIAGRC